MKRRFIAQKNGTKTQHWVATTRVENARARTVCGIVVPETEPGGEGWGIYQALEKPMWPCKECNRR